MSLTPPKLNRGNVKGALIFVAAMLLSVWGAAMTHEVLGHALVGYLMGAPIERVELVPQLQLQGVNTGFLQYVEFGPGVDLSEPRYWPVFAAGFVAEVGAGLLLTLMLIRIRFWLYSAVWVNARCPVPKFRINLS